MCSILLDLDFHLVRWFSIRGDFFKLINFNWRLITLQYCGSFCHTLTWISHSVHVLPILNPPPTSLPSYPSGLSQCTGFECLVSCIELGSISHMVIYMFQCYSLNSSHALLLPLELLSLRYPYYPKKHIDSIQFLSINKWKNKLCLFNLAIKSN